jgi:hypothetical protein
MGKVLLIVILFAVATYLITRAMQQRGTQPVSRRRAISDMLPKPPPRSVAPDDDEAFLRDLERKWRRHQEPPESN